MNKKKNWYVLLVVLLLAGWLVIRRDSADSGPAADFNRNPAAVVYSKHARCRMGCRHIDETEVKEILLKGKINTSKSELNGKPDPKYALEGITHDGQHVRIVFAAAPEKLVVVTVIDLDREWACECR